MIERNNEILDNEPLEDVKIEMESYYDKHFKSYEIINYKFNFKDKIEKVWGVYFDSISDIAYVFMASIIVIP